MKRLVIAVDCDDVLLPTTPFFIDAYNTQYGTSISLAQVHTVNEEIWGVEPEEALRRVASIMETDEYRLLSVSAEEAEILKRLSKQHTLHLVTARKETERELTQFVLDRDLPGVFTSIDLVGWEGSKGEVCKRLGADVLIDDSARHLHNAVEHGLPTKGAILFGEYSWNEMHRNEPGLHYCATWRDVEEYLLHDGA